MADDDLNVEVTIPDTPDVEALTPAELRDPTAAGAGMDYGTGIRWDIPEPESEGPDRWTWEWVKSGWFSGIDAADAGLELENPFHLSMFEPRRPDSEDIPAVEGYNSLVDGDIGHYPPELFIDSGSPEEDDYLKAQYDHELKLAERAGTAGRIFGALTNPLIWAAGGIGAAGGMGAFGRAAVRAGGAALAPLRALPTAGLEVGAETASEVALQRRQITRTTTESVVNVAAAGVAGYVLGRYADSLDDKARLAANQSAGDAMSRVLGVVPDLGPAADLGSPDAIVRTLRSSEENRAALAGLGIEDEATLRALAETEGAQMVARQFLREPTEGEQALMMPFEGGSVGAARTAAGEGEVMQKRWVKWTGIGVGARLATAVSPMARKLYRTMVDTPFSFVGETVGPSIERLRGQFQAMSVGGAQEQRRQYAALKKSGLKMSSEEFGAEVAKAMRRGDVSELAVGAGKEQVEAAARFWREATDKLLQRGADAGIETLEAARKAGGPQFAASYFPRIYNLEKLDRINEFESMLTDYFVSQGTALEAALASARNVVHKLTGGEPPAPGRITVSVSDPSTKARTLAVPDEILEPFLDSDPIRAFNSQFNRLGTEVLMREAFGKRRFSDELTEVWEDYTRRIDEARLAGDAKKVRKLDREREVVRDDLRALEGRLYGTRGRPEDPNSALVRAGRAIRTSTAAAYLGGVVLTSLPDLVRPIMQQGFMPFAKSLALLLSPSRLARSRRELTRMGVALELANATRLRNAADLDDFQGRWGRLATEAVGWGTGITPYTWATKTLAGVGSMDALSRWSLKAAKGTLGKSRQRALQRAGLNTEMQQRIAQQIEAHAEIDRGLYMAETARWTDEEAAEAFEAAVRSEVDFTMIEPGLGDRPRVMDGEVGKLILQFQSFGISINNKLVAGGMSRVDAEFIAGLMVMIAMGAGVTVAKDKLRGRDATDDPGQLLRDGIDRSGVLGVWNILYQQTRRLSGDQPSRMLGKGAIAQVMGPGVGGFAPQAAGVAFSAARGEPDVYSAVRLLPFNNAFHIRDILEQAGAVPYELPNR